MNWRKYTGALLLLFIVLISSSWARPEDKDPKKLWYGNDIMSPILPASSFLDVPAPVIISSQPIKINNQNNRLNRPPGGSRGRMLNTPLEGFNGKSTQQKRQIQYVQQPGGVAATVIDPASGQSFVYTQQQDQGEQQQVQYQAAPMQVQNSQSALPQQGQMYVLSDGNTYMHYNPVQQSQAQASFSSRSGEVAAEQQQQQVQYIQAQPVNPIPQPVTFIQPQQKPESSEQQKAHNAQQQPQQQQQHAQVLQNVQNILQPHQFLQQAQQLHQQMQQQRQTPGAEERAAVQQQQQSQQQQPQQQQNQQGNFVIQPHTYVQSPGGLRFTVPVPMPVDQAQQQQQQHGNRQQHRPQHHHQQQHRAKPNPNSSEEQNQPNRERNEHREKKKEGRPNHLVHRFMEAINPNRKSIMERVETNAAIPILASSGLVLGLGALAAGWYLSKSNREVGILRRVGRPATPTVSPYPTLPKLGSGRVKRQIPQFNPMEPTHEVDQATFFQSIIQHALEKQQEKYDVPAAVSSYPINTNVRSENVDIKPHSYRNDRVDDAIEKVSKAGKKHGKGHHPKKSWRQIKTFASVAVPAIVLGGAVVSITVLIFFWYLSGTNREIAFLEPAAYSRKKRSITTTTALSDGWFHKTIAAIHKNPYEEGVAVDPLSEDEISKHGGEGGVSKAVLGGILAAGTVVAAAAVVMAWFFSSQGGNGFPWLEQAHHVGWGHPHQHGHHGGHHGGPGHHRSARSVNDMSYGQADNPGFLASILNNFEVTQNIINQLQDAGYRHETCAKRIFCEIMSSQSDDTLRLITEKRFGTFLSMLPESLSSSLSRTMSDVMSSIHKRNCSVYTCRGETHPLL